MILGGVIGIIVSLALVGLAVHLIVTFIPMPEKFKTAIYVVAGVACLLYLLSAFGLWNGPQLR